MINKNDFRNVVIVLFFGNTTFERYLKERFIVI